MEHVDRTRVGVYGKGFEGILALKVLGLMDGLIQCGAAVSPITDFRLQAATFSERYLGLSARQDESYVKASVLGEVERLRGKRLLLAHGTADGLPRYRPLLLDRGKQAPPPENHRQILPRLLNQQWEESQGGVGISAQGLKPGGQGPRSQGRRSRPRG
ncbi:inactive dipeptidyl peptidase 10-like [Mobula birostris]|uniref:inactive dipeptidyl peptidase 10-like n=1 Tax=Mobula birostris TaxID=1983395 RepID=UPI003B2837D6